ncbi:MAG TPA: sialidase family protein [Gaiellaceae bacterium]
MRAVAALAALAAVLATPVALTARAPAGLSLSPHATRGTATVGRSALPTDQINVSNAAHPQAEVAVAVDPRDPNVLLGGSGSFERSDRVYSSTDGGATWSSLPLPVGRGLCAFGDPAVTIDAAGRQYYAYLAGGCLDFDVKRVSLMLATRPDAQSAWVARKPAIAGTSSFNDKEAIAVDTAPASPHAGRLYLAWSRLSRPSGVFEIVVSRSDDAGATWSRAVRAGGTGGPSQTYASVATGADGAVYVAWLTLDQHVVFARSADGGDHFARAALVALAAQLPAGLCHFGGTGIPAQPKRCIASAPLLTVDRIRGRIYVTWGGAGSSGREQNVYVSAYDAATVAPVVSEVQVNPPDGATSSDQFLPASAVDESTGRLWACWYDTTGDRTRKRTRYTCSASSDGGATWAAPVAAATTFSNLTVKAATSFEYGDYAGVAVANGIAHPMWTDSRDLATSAEEIYTTALQLP